MDYVEGHGKARDGNELTVRIKKAENGYILDLDDYAYEPMLRRILDSTVFVGGTYPAPTGSLLKAWYAMNEFFSRGWTGTVHGEIEEIPGEEGVVY